MKITVLQDTVQSFAEIKMLASPLGVLQQLKTR